MGSTQPGVSSAKKGLVSDWPPQRPGKEAGSRERGRGLE